MKIGYCGHKVSNFIKHQIDINSILLPTSLSLKYLEDSTGCRAQTIGLAYDDYIAPFLRENGINSRKTGNPVNLYLEKI